MPFAEPETAVGTPIVVKYRENILPSRDACLERSQDHETTFQPPVTKVQRLANNFNNIETMPTDHGIQGSDFR